MKLPVIDERPKTRGDCAGGVRPCPWVSCKHNLMVDVTAHDAIRPTLGFESGGRGKPSAGRREPVISAKVGRKHFRVAREDLGEQLVDWFEQHALASCALDVADLGGVTLEEVGEVIGVTRERVRQIEAMGLRKLRDAGIDLRAFLEER